MGSKLVTLWTAVLVALVGVGIALVAAAITAQASVSMGHFKLWSSSEMVVAYLIFAASLYVLLAILYEWPLLGKDRREKRLNKVTDQADQANDLWKRCVVKLEAAGTGSQLETDYAVWLKQAKTVLGEVAPSFLPNFRRVSAGEHNAFQYMPRLTQEASVMATALETSMDVLGEVADYLRGE